MLTDIEIAQNTKMLPITQIAAELNIPEEAVERTVWLLEGQDRS